MTTLRSYNPQPSFGVHDFFITQNVTETSWLSDPRTRIDLSGLITLSYEEQPRAAGRKTDSVGYRPPVCVHYPPTLRVESAKVIYSYQSFILTLLQLSATVH
ncbi:hypothetical protein HHI36_019192 [Cryptolaemus montrouzieri]|uniref:Uncharacterized protein n=1 Tax=Cryptolaemus montrouzieri TaxID=559131 RepID=A0ABD2P2W7_9CUCU